MLRRYYSLLRNPLRKGKGLSPAQLARLRHYWSNDAWSAATEFLETMLRWLPRTTGTVLECGSGLSTLILVAATAGSARRVVSLEHNEDWAARVRALLPPEPNGRVEMAISPIRSYGAFDWYAVGSVGQLGAVGFVVCDGPPGSTRGGRYGLGPVLSSALSPGCIVMLDDAARDAERQIIARWRTELPAEVVEENERYCVMRVGAH
jgi:hypothetical protein